MNTTGITPYNLFIDAMECIESAEDWGGIIVAIFDDNTRTSLTINDLRLIAEQYRKLEKERDSLQDDLDSLKSRINDVLEDF